MSLKKSSFLFASGTVLSRILGLLRESVLAGVFGASYLLDIFFIANRIPNMLREIAAEGALGSSFTKVYTALSQKNPLRAKQLLVSTTLFVLLVLGGFCLLCILGAPVFVKALMLFESSDRGINFFNSTVGLTRILFPFILFMSLASIFAGVLHQKGRFFISALSPILLNIGYIFGALVLAVLFNKFAPDWLEIYFAEKSICGLAFGVLLGGFLQTLLLFWSIKDSFFYKSNEQTHSDHKKFSLSNLLSEDLKKVLILMGPMVIAASSGQINVLVNTNFATSLEMGSVSYLNFAFRLLQLPIGVFAVAIGTVSLPRFSKSISNGMNSLFNQEVDKSIELSLWLLMPCFFFLVVYKVEIIKLLFYHGSFSLNDTIATSSCLFYYSFGLVGYGLIKILSSVFYAIEKTNYAMKVSLVGIFANFLLNYFFVSSYGYNGLALASSFTLTINALLLLWGLKKYKVYALSKNIYINFFLLLLSGMFFVFCQKYVLALLSKVIENFALSPKIDSLAKLTTGGILLIIIFYFSYWMKSKSKFKYKT